MDVFNNIYTNINTYLYTILVITIQLYVYESLSTMRVYALRLCKILSKLTYHFLLYGKREKFYN